MRLGVGRYARGGETTAVKNPIASLRKVFPWILPYWPVLVFGFLCMILTTYLGPQPFRVIGYTIDKVIPSVLRDGGKNLLPVRNVVLLLLALYVGQSLFGFLRTYFLHVAGQRMLHQLRIRLYEHFQQLPLTYYDNHATGDLMSRMTGDVEQIENLMVHGLDVLIMGLFGMLLSFYYIWRIHNTLALVILIPVPVIAVSIFFFGRKVRLIYRTIRDRVGDLNARLQDNLSGIRVIKAFSREATEQTQVNTDSEQVMHMNIQGIRMWSSFGPAMGTLGSLGSLAAFGVGICLVVKNQLHVGELMTVVMLVGNFYGPIGSLFQFFDSIQRSLAAGDRIFEVLDSVPDIQDPAEPLPLDDVHGEVELRSLCFCYATGEEVLHDVNVHARPGERIALVGRSGAGKSSFINLIPRFYDALEGQVLVDSIDVRAVRQADLRRHIALVLQETFLFNGSVRDNLRYGKLDATDEELEEAAKIANAHEFIVRLADGYDTQIGERGVKLSGGQKQRLAIARAVLANPRILILDEATSSVDSESEFLIHQTLDRLMEGRTTFIIAHRLSTIRNADVILVLEDGHIVERGNHTVLLRANGLYAQMYRQQFWLDDLFSNEEEEERAEQTALPEVELPAME